MNILVIGSGGREHALVWKLSMSPRVSRLYCAPGNPGIASLARCIPLKANDTSGLIEFAKRESIDLLVVGPEQPLAEGIVDRCQEKGLTVFGPTSAAAQLEWSKAFAKDFMDRHKIPTAAYRTFSAGQIADARAYVEVCPLPVVLKTDGLAAGKGVAVCTERGEALSALHQMAEEKVFGAAGSVIVVEEFMRGQEASVFAVCDGQRYVTLAPAQDHKRVFDGDRGKNTGGMGAYAPTPVVTPAALREIERTIIVPTLRGMAAEGRPYAGCLYVGLMMTETGPKVVEYNCRFGDPETQVVLPLYGGDLAELLLASACGDLSGVESPAVNGNAVCVILASGGYPDAYAAGFPIDGLDRAAGVPGAMLFHAGTKEEQGRVATAGGRVLGVTSLVDGGLDEAVSLAYRVAEMITFAGMHFRRDIGAKGLATSAERQ